MFIVPVFLFCNTISYGHYMVITLFIFPEHLAGWIDYSVHRKNELFEEKNICIFFGICVELIQKVQTEL